MKPNKLTTLLLLPLLTILRVANGQIVYTDINDITYTSNRKCGACFHYSHSETYLLNLNNDGSADFNITAYRAVTHADGCTNCYCLDDILNRVLITARHDNSVLIDSSGTALISGSKISSLSEWSTGLTGNIILRSFYYGGNTSTWWQCATLKEGDWPNSVDRYLGLKILSNGQTYYGWARLSVFVDKGEATFTIKAYAYESTPGKAIYAGDKGAPLANSSVSNASKKDAASLNLKIVPNPVSSATTITFSLAKPAKISVALYDKSGRLIKKLADDEFSQGFQQIKIDVKDLNAGIYLLRLESSGFIQTQKLIVTK